MSCILILLVTLFYSFFIQYSYGTCSEDGTCCDKLECEYSILQKLIHLEVEVASLTEELKGAKDTVAELNETVKNERSSDGTTYIRWGRTECPTKAFLVNDGYVAGSRYSHPGSAVNPLCLPKDPNYVNQTDGFQSYGRIYGAEYETSSQHKWRYLHDHDIPCAVCRIPRSNVLMVPGKNTCHENYMLEYKGYLMSEHYSHTGPSEYVCVDDNPEILEGGHANHDGRLFYFVEGVCGSLKCPPYKNGLDITCAVCSFSPGSQSTQIQPYI